MIMSLLSAAAAMVIPTITGIPTFFQRAVVPPGPVEAVILGPLFDRPFACIDHPEGDVGALGDAFGADCMVLGGPGGRTGGYFRLFRGDGKRNADWYGWHAHVLAPFDGRIAHVQDNPVTNRPGSMSKAMASNIVFRRDDGLVVVYAHVTAIRVKAGDRVTAGQIVALDGNNGMARAPHIHVGAFRDRTPYQIRWDQRAEGRLFKDD